MTRLLYIALMMSVLRDSACSASNDEALRPELRALSDSPGLALAEIGGNVITIHPFGSPFIQRHLDASFLISRFDRAGLRIVGSGGSGSDVTGVDQVVVCDRRGKVSFHISGVINVHGLALSPDGTKIAVIAQDSVTHFNGLQILVVNSDHSVPPVLVATASSTLSTEIAWSADGKELVFSKDGQVRIFNLETRLSRALCNGTEPSWSPDGTWIAFLSKDSHLTLRNMSTGLVARPSKRKSQSTAIWSPDSRWFAAAADGIGSRRNPNCYTNTRLYAYRVADLSSTEVLYPCGLKPELYGWISIWQEWGSDSSVAAH